MRDAHLPGRPTYKYMPRPETRVLHKPNANSYSTCTSYNTECKRTEEHGGGADTFTVKGAKDNSKWYKDL